MAGFDTCDAETPRKIRGVRNELLHPKRVEGESVLKHCSGAYPEDRTRDVMGTEVYGSEAQTVRLINTTNEWRLVQGHETPLRVKGDIEDVSSELCNVG
ncbi:hypothetical protein TNCV_132281 [Trichonephila clavipes]|nr:hypothetical protein TNCV_132281 [Trichonephila clavipes]